MHGQAKEKLRGAETIAGAAARTTKEQKQTAKHNLSQTRHQSSDDDGADGCLLLLLLLLSLVAWDCGKMNLVLLVVAVAKLQLGLSRRLLQLHRFHRFPLSAF